MAMLRAAVDALILRTDAVEQHDRLHETQISELRAELLALKASQQGKSDAAKLSHNRSRSTRYAASRTAAAKPAPVASAPTEQGALLAVDLWGGRHSVAISRTSPGGAELRFFNEGETSGRVTVKQADVGTQRATFATPSGEFTLAPKER
jgi:type II secretory pathway pseudopilin PulG